MKLVERHDATPTSFKVLVDGKHLYDAEREDDGRGNWALYSATGKRTKLDRDAYSNDLLERIECNMIGVRFVPEPEPCEQVLLLSVSSGIWPGFTSTSM